MNPNGYSIATCPEPIGDALRQDAIAFWLQHGAIPDPAEAARRVDELVCIARNTAGHIVGVSTAYPTQLQTEAVPRFVYRMFVRERDRHLQLACGIMRQSIEGLRQRRARRPAIAGLVLVAENTKLNRRGGHRILRSLGWQRVGADARGQDVWCFDFAPTTRQPG